MNVEVSIHGPHRQIPGDRHVLRADRDVAAAIDARRRVLQVHADLEVVELDIQRQAAGLRRHRDLPAQTLLQALVDEVRRFNPNEQHDDITMIVARCGER